MPKVMKAREVRVTKSVRLKPETIEILEQLQEREGLGQGKIIDIALQLLKEKREKELA